MKTIFNSNIKFLTRGSNPADIPAIDRAVALATCELLIALDRTFIEDIFFSRSVAACNGAWVWAEPVLRVMAQQRTVQTEGASEPAALPKRVRMPSIASPRGLSAPSLVVASGTI